MPAISSESEPICRVWRVDLSADPSASRTLAIDEVHVFFARLDEHPIDSLLPLLSPDETERAGRFVFPRDRNHFIVARGLLRRLLAGYLNSSPGELQFGYGAKGKPFLLGNPVMFNLAHSYGRALYAFSRNREVGVDLEYSLRDVDYYALAKRFFSPSEVAAIHACSMEIRKRAFFNCWTRKEAYIKALGDGLSMPLDQFEVTVDERAALLRNQMDPDECNRWSIYSPETESGYIAAVVVEAQFSHLATFKNV